MEKDRAREIAAAEGLTKLDEKQLAQLGRRASPRRASSPDKLPKDLHWSEEIALVFRLADAGGRQAMTDLAFLGLADAAELIRARKLSPVEYTQALLDRIDGSMAAITPTSA